ncbi:hypothetical protein [Spirosoma endbachense]|uniref:Septum formation inhibitor Maf n=1 Tax=Spirosoma endbachense TaxID=2666025 RepID=A0A6P1W2U2_9BACT|nr:hypothetical protein [Spirosoma endbachense]QHV98622.1 hypothetical protein GJR95_28050 [Spirosoma endbachense]
MFVQKNFLLIVLALAVIFAFAMKATIFQQQPTGNSGTANAAPADFGSYWFTGKAELNSYRLEQAQYGALNPGEAVLIFVTEDFRTDKQVKSETPESHDKSVPVLKTNISKKFVTGIYDYSLFTSVFTPISNPLFPNTLKVSTSGQEWCGHSYIQLNYRNNGYLVNGKSYFEKEVDEDYTVEKAMLEDELWNRIRINPDKLPTGEIQLIPGTMAARLRHKRLEPLPAKLKIDKYEGVLYPGKLLKSYVIEYPTDDRTLTIIFESQFPHKIVGWEEIYKSKDNLLTSRAVLKKTILTDYWNHNAPADSTLRQLLVSTR